MENNNLSVETSKAKDKLILTFSLFSKSLTFYKHRFLSFVEMYLWGLLGALPLAAVLLILLILWFLDINLSNAFAFPVIFALLLMTALWSLYYGIRAQIGIILLIKNTEIKAKEAFLETKSFFWSYLIVSLVSSFFLILLTLLLIIPGIIFYVYWAFATLLVVVEGIKTTMPALKRSKSLVKGYWWSVAGRLFFISVLYFLFISLLSIPSSSTVDAEGVKSFMFLSKEIGHAYNIFVNLLSAILSPLLVVYTYFLYQDLLQKKK